MISYKVFSIIKRAKEQGWKKLHLNYEQIKEIPSEIFELEQLEVLSLIDNNISSIPAEIKYLSRLKVLDLAGNPLTYISPAIGSLEALKVLDLTGSRLIYFPDEIANLSNLNKVNLSYSNLTSIPPELFSIKSLAILNLTHNKLAAISPSIRLLSNLRVLNLESNKLRKICPEIGWLHNLRILNLDNNKLKNLPKEIRYLSSLRALLLQNNLFKRFPKIILQLENLTHLSISKNKIRELPSKINLLQQLQVISLSYNPLTTIPEELVTLPNLKSLDFLNSYSLKSPPPEIAQRGLESIRNYINEMKFDTDFLYEIKLLLVGEGRVGKTSIAKSLSNDEYSFQNEQSTEGIDITKWVIPAKDNKLNKDIRVNIWDFGGQEIYHSTHQFFLTRRSLYILVTESRQEDKHEDFYYWLNIIKLLGDTSPIIIVLNKCDQPSKELPIIEYQKNFSNIVDFKKASCKPDFKDTIKTLQAEIRRIILNPKLLPHIGGELPKVWVNIRTELEDARQNGKDYISYNEYLHICNSYGLDEERALWLGQYFHDLGVILHFQDDIILRKTIILNYEWVTQGVYNVLDNKKVIGNKGRFSDDDLIYIWSDSRYIDKHHELLSLMKNRKFELCFQLPSGEYLAPQLLPVDEIQFTWKTKHNNLHFEYKYKFMPKGILTRFIVKRNQDISNNLYWRYGVLLESEDTRAIIREKYFDRKITITLEGSNKKEFLGVIRKTFQEIHNNFNNLQVYQMVPCNCPDCTNSQSPNFFKYSDLQQYQNEGFTEIDCTRKKIKKVNVTSLINDTFSKHKSSKISNNKLLTTHQSQNIYINQVGELEMNENKITVGRDVVGSTLSIGEISGTVTNSIGQIPESKDSDIKSLLSQLQEAIESDEKLTNEQKSRALNQVKDLANAAQDPQNNEMKYQAEDAINILEKMMKRLPTAITFVKASSILLSQIGSFFS